MNEIAEKLQRVQRQIRRVAERVGRNPETIRLVAATKNVSAERVRQAVGAGIRICGENRWQEAQAKMGQIGEQTGLVWHFVGRLQRRKLKQMVGRVALIHSVESCEQAKELSQRAQEQGLRQDILLQVNVGGEATKGGFSPEDLLANIPFLDSLSHLHIQGLMTVPPKENHPEAARPYFRQLKQLAEEIRAQHPHHIHMSELSMGMSGDFEVAIEEGATLVRIGTAIFGERIRETKEEGQEEPGIKSPE